MPPMAPPERVCEWFVTAGVDDPEGKDADDVTEVDDADAELVEFDVPGAAARTQPILEHDFRFLAHERPLGGETHGQRVTV